MGFMPHMHVRGKAFRYELILPDGQARTLLEVPRYDFNWQLAYRFADPPLIPAGSKVRATGWYDNTANNPANPDPSKQVRWGPQTSDEMMIGYVEYYIPTEARTKTAARLGVFVNARAQAQRAATSQPRATPWVATFDENQP